MSAQNEGQGFRPIGSHLPKIETLQEPLNSIPMRSPPSSGITGQVLPAGLESSSIGQAHSATDAESLPSAAPHARYSALDRRPGSPRDLRMRYERGRENRTKIAAHISRLLSHYWAANEDSRLRAAIAQDWLTDLAEFHEQIVADACQGWRRSESRRPTIADIRARCIEDSDTPRERAPVIDRQATEAVAQEWSARYRDSAEWRDAAAKERGFAGFADAMAYGLVAAGLAPKPVRSKE